MKYILIKNYKIQKKFNKKWLLFKIKKVNLPHAITRRIVKKFEQGVIQQNLFDEAQKEIYELIKNDSFKRFYLKNEFTK